MTKWKELALELAETGKELTRQIVQLEADYYELILTVSKKCPGESRHETALRYITERENQEGRVAMSNALKESER